MKEEAPQPKYRHLANVLRERLRIHPQGYKLPSVRALMSRFGVSQHTVLAALRVLEEEELISRRHGSGIYANPDRRPVTVCFCRPQDPEYLNDSREKVLRDACTARGWQFGVDRFDALHVAPRLPRDRFLGSPPFTKFSPLSHLSVTTPLPPLPTMTSIS